MNKTPLPFMGGGAPKGRERELPEPPNLDIKAKSINCKIKSFHSCAASDFSLLVQRS